MSGAAPSSFALSEVLGALSYALDITEGEPPGHAVRTLAIGMRIAEQLRLDVIAEGVETEDQLNRLRELGCDYAQGFLLARPMPAAEIVSRLSD
jgi:EAL domain-containing protein (putative c-di-GMP-specific phosphodiesterase class I)